MVDYRKLEKQPLVFALTEVRFSPVLKIADFIPELQEALRKLYPLPEVQKQQSVQVEPGGIAVNSRDRWVFSSPDRRSTVTVDQDRIIYSTLDYPRFDDFSKNCTFVANALNKIVTPELLLRIGLRYGDCIRINQDENLEDFVDPFFGFPKMAPTLGSPEYQRDELGLKTAIGRMMIKSFYGVHPFLCMPDVQGFPGIPNQDESPSMRILLDFDHIWESNNVPEKFNCDNISSILAQLHELSREAFWKITTEEAKDKKWS